MEKSQTRILTEPWSTEKDFKILYRYSHASEVLYFYLQELKKKNSLKKAHITSVSLALRYIIAK